MKITSGILTPEQMWKELGALQSDLKTMGFIQIEVYWGWACNLPMDSLWKSEAIAVEHLVAHARHGESSSIFEMGSSDLYVYGANDSFTCQFCHDSDIHLEGNFEDMISEVRDRWIKLQFPGSTYTIDQWVPFSGTAA